MLKDLVIGGTVWERVESVTLLEEVRQGGGP